MTAKPFTPPSYSSAQRYMFEVLSCLLTSLLHAVVHTTSLLPSVMHM